MALAINSPRLYIAITKFLPALFSELFLRNEVSDYGWRNAMNCKIVDHNFFLSTRANKEWLKSFMTFKAWLKMPDRRVLQYTYNRSFVHNNATYLAISDKQHNMDREDRMPAI